MTISVLKLGEMCEWEGVVLGREKTRPWAGLCPLSGLQPSLFFNCPRNGTPPALEESQ